MGLDQYLQGSVFLWTNEDSEQKKADKIKELIGVEYPVTEVKVELMYWRKANQIHKWFVDQVQDGNDDCGTYYVSEENLKDLAHEIEQALLTENTENLEPTSGFFFGGTEIDDYYWETLRRTKEEIYKLLDSPDLKKMDLYYTSSW
jgi:hypothetical protein